MTKDSFIRMTIDEKIQWLWNFGEILYEKSYYDTNITLFACDHFLVEVFFNRVAYCITGVEIQDNSQLLFEYVKEIELSELLQ